MFAVIDRPYNNKMSGKTQEQVILFANVLNRHECMLKRIEPKEIKSIESAITFLKTLDVDVIGYDFMSEE